MKKFVVERNLPGAGNLSIEELRTISQASCKAINELGMPYHWVQTFVTDDKLYCTLSHLFSLIIWLWKKDESPAVNVHGKEALNFHITVFAKLIRKMGMQVD